MTGYEHRSNGNWDVKVAGAPPQREKRPLQARALLRSPELMGGLLRPIKPVSSITTKTIRKIKNSIFAMPAAANAIPPKPKKPAMIATMRNTSAQSVSYTHLTLPTN